MMHHGNGSSEVINTLRSFASLAVVLHHVALAALQPIGIGRAEAYKTFDASWGIQVGATLSF